MACIINFFDTYAPTSSHSETKPWKAKEPITEEKPTLEGMLEMMKSLTLFTKDIAKTRDNEQYKNSYGPRPYWNNRRGPTYDTNRQAPRRNEATKNKNLNLCEEPKEDLEVFDSEDHGINLVEDFTDDDDFGRILVEEYDWDEK